MHEVEVAFMAIMNMRSPAVCERFKLQQKFQGSICIVAVLNTCLCSQEKFFLESEKALTLHIYSVSVSTCIRSAGCQKLAGI